MKTLKTILCAGMALLTLAGCGAQQAASTASEKPAQTATT